MSGRNYYQILGIPRNASDAEIRIAYKRAALVYHPDKGKTNNSDKFNEIHSAYETLINNQTKDQYDNILAINSNSESLMELFIRYKDLVKEICEKYNVSSDDKIEIMQLFDPSDYDFDVNDKQQAIDLAYNHLANKIWKFIPKFIYKKFKEDYPYVGSIIDRLSNTWRYWIV